MSKLTVLFVRSGCACAAFQDPVSVPAAHAFPPLRRIRSLVTHRIEALAATISRWFPVAAGPINHARWPTCI